MLLLFGAMLSPLLAQSIALDPKAMQRIGSVDERFQSYNIEMVEVTGGRFWKPYRATAGEAQASGRQPGATPAGIDPNLFEYRAPIDLSNVGLRKLAAGLGPTYVRVSGTWANTVYFHDSDDPAPEKPPTGFNAILTRQQWKGVVDFVRAVNGKLITSVAIGPGNRDEKGIWTPEQARRVFAYTKAVGGSIAAVEFMNEPNYATTGGAPKGYDAAAFARDIEVFRRFVKEVSPQTLFLGPGTVGEAGVLARTSTGRLKTEDLLNATGSLFDAFSYHLYSAVSQRCASRMPALGTTANAALTQEWLARPLEIHAFYAGLRDRLTPGKPLWLTETADTACGGDAWATTFLDTFRYLNQAASLAQRGVQVSAHNTLSASDYGLLDEHSYDPRPNYWAAVLWRRLMGSVVLNPGSQSANDLYTYAHCQANRPGGVTVLAINAGATEQEIQVPLQGERYTLSATQPESAVIQLNGQTLQAGRAGSLPKLTGTTVGRGRLRLAPASITFLVFPQANNQACQ
jgi:hypothetical protein